MSSFDARMTELRARFVTRLVAEQSSFAAAATLLNRSEIRRLAHGLSGSAGVFGFRQVSGAARAVEEAVDGCLDDHKLGGLCAALLSCLASVAQRD